MGEFRFCDKCKKPVEYNKKLKFISTQHYSYWSIDMTLFRIKNSGGSPRSGIVHICEDCMKPILDYLKLEKVLQ